MTVRTGSAFFAEALSAYGLTHVFFMPTVMLPAMAKMKDAGIRAVSTHGEAAAVYMADGYARAASGPAVCLAQNVGTGNVAAGLREARLAGSPVIALTGGHDPKERYRNVYQEIDDLPMLVPVTTWSAEVDRVDRLPDLLRQAFRAATTGSPGPVHLRLQGRHGNVAAQEADLDLVVEERFRRLPPFRPRSSVEDVAAAAAVLREAQRPLIVAGGGVSQSDAAAAVRELARRCRIPVATSLNGKGTIPEDDPLSVGLVGKYSRSCANITASEADVAFFIGSGAGSQVTNHWQLLSPDVRVVQLDINPEQVGRNYPGALPIVADARAGTGQLLDELERTPVDPSRDAWLDRVAELKARWREESADRLESESVPLRPERVCNDLSGLLPDECLVVADTGHSAVWTGTILELRNERQRYIRCAGTLGWAFPASLGAQCALPETPVICFTGDGGFYYHIAELETAVRHQIGTTVIVNNNRSLNQEQRQFDAAYGGTQSGDAKLMWMYEEVDLAAVAETFGCRGLVVRKAEELAAALETALGSAGPTVIDVRTDVGALHERAWRQDWVES